MLGRVRSQAVPCRFCGNLDGDGHLFWECTFPPLVEIRDNPEFHDLMKMDKAHWPRHVACFGRAGFQCSLESTVPLLGLLMLLRVPSVWLRLRLGGIHLVSWLSGFPLLSLLRLGHPNVWTDGGLVLNQVTGISSSGAGFFPHQSSDCWSGRRWGHVDHVRSENSLQSCRGHCSVPGPLQTVQRAEMRSVILALQSSDAVHLGVDNLGVVRHVGCLLDGHHGSVPFELVKDGDLLLIIERMLILRGLEAFRITKVKGHADDSMVLDGRVREIDRLGNDAADEAADFGRREVGDAVINARRTLSGVLWSLVPCCA